MPPPRFPPAVVLLAALLAPGAAAGEEEPGDIPVPGYALPPGLTDSARPAGTRGEVLEAALRSVTHPRSGEAAREGWRTLAGLGRDAAPAAVERLRTADWFGRSLLLRALGSMEEPLIEPLLVEAAGDPAWAVREAAAEALGRATSPEGAVALLPMLEDPSWRVRQAAVEGARRRALRGHLDRDAVSASLLRLAAGGDPDVRFAACLALADLCEPRAADVLLDALSAAVAAIPASADDREDDAEGAGAWRFRAAISDALRLLRGVCDGCGADPRVSDALRAMTMETTRPLAAHALREWFRLQPPEGRRDPAALSALVHAYVHAEGADPVALAALERTLVDLGEDAAAALMTAISEPDRARRLDHQGGRVRVALDLVVRLRGTAAADTLATLLADRRVRGGVREHAAELARRLCPAALGPLFRTLFADGNEDYGMQSLLLKAIAASGGDDVPALLAESLVSTTGAPPPRPVRRAAVEVLRTRTDLRDEGVLLRAAASETDGDVLAGVLSLLRDGAPARAAEALAPFLDDPREQVRLAAADALEKAPGPATVRLLLRRIDAEDGRAQGDADPGDDAEFARAVEERRTVRRIRLRTALVASLRFAAGGEAAPVVAALLSHAAPEVREAAAAHLGALRDPRATPAILAALAAEGARAAAGEPPVPGLRDSLLSAAVACGGPEADAFVDRTLAGPDGEARSLVLRALATGDPLRAAPESVAALLDRAPAGSPDRLLAMEVLGHRRVPPRTDLLLRVLREAAHDEERRKAIETLGRTRDPAAVGSLAALLPAASVDGMDEREFAAGILAAEALGEIRSPTAAPALAALLARHLPSALRGDGASAPAQLVAVTMGALGRCGGDVALRALCDAAFDAGFSRAAETATRAEPEARDPSAPVRPVLPPALDPVARALAAALGRFRDGPLSEGLAATLTRLETDGRAFALSEEWLAWLADALGAPPRRLPYRPRWSARIVLMERTVLCAPRETPFDREARYRLFQQTTEVVPDWSAAALHLERWRLVFRAHDRFGADREAEVLDGLERVVAGGALLAAGRTAEGLDAFDAAVAASGESETVARLPATVLYRAGAHLDRAEALALRAVRSEPGSAVAARLLGRIRLARGDAAGALEPLTTAFRLARGGAEGVASRTAWYAFALAQALAATGDVEGALETLAPALRADDTVLDRAQVDRSLAAVRALPTWAEALDAARAAFDEQP